MPIQPINHDRRGHKCHYKMNFHGVTAINTPRIQPVCTVTESFVMNPGVPHRVLMFTTHFEPS